MVLTYLTQENGCNKEKVTHWMYWEYTGNILRLLQLSGNQMGGWMKRWLHILAEFSEDLILARNID